MKVEYEKEQLGRREEICDKRSTKCGEFARIWLGWVNTKHSVKRSDKNRSFSKKRSTKKRSVKRSHKKRSSKKR